MGTHITVVSCGAVVIYIRICVAYIYIQYIYCMYSLYSHIGMDVSHSGQIPKGTCPGMHMGTHTTVVSCGAAVLLTYVYAWHTYTYSMSVRKPTLDRLADHWTNALQNINGLSGMGMWRPRHCMAEHVFTTGHKMYLSKSTVIDTHPHA